MTPSSKKKFDGYKKETNTLIDAKDWTVWLINKSFSKDSVVNDARLSLSIAKQAGAKLEWHVPSQATKQKIDSLFHDKNINRIIIIVNPKK